MRVEPLELEIAYDLIDLVDAAKGGDLLDRVRALRRKLALELGVVIPLVRTRDNLELPASTYTIRVHGVDVGRGEAPPGHVLVLGDDTRVLPGIQTREPVFGLPATWVPLEFRHQAEVTGATVVDRASVITTHLAEVVRRNAGRLLGRQDVKMLIDVVKQTDPVVIDELNGANVTDRRDPARPAVAARRGRRHPRPRAHLRSGLGALPRHQGHRADRRGRAHRARSGDLGVARARTTSCPVHHARPARRALARRNAAQPAITARTSRSTRRPPSSSRSRSRATAEAAEMKGIEPVLVCATQLRPSLRRLLHAAAPRLPVLAYTELGAQLELDTIGVVNLGQPAAV